MARRGKKPEDYGQLALFEEKEPDWLKPVNQLGYSISTQEEGVGDADAADFILDRQGNDLGRLTAPDEDSDDLVQFAEWLARKSVS
ncbi:hypothetical protein [Geobacter argillaceus]|uniref:Uncharacterized protein n=1 Tax=Geobacter argillaceus TaxID=345631 RepID=A0A562VKG1_9BACT|nr:hypothetical protein [Geobacter argillaceus]TWJ18368.1 hypothetical protein JN12_02588 [Geobacter argillaceus]